MVDNEIKKTRRGLQNIAVNYIEKLVGLYVKEQEECELQEKNAIKELLLHSLTGQQKFDQENAVKAKFYRSHDQSQILTTLEHFCQIAKSAKVNNLFLSSFVQLVQQKQN